MAMVFTKPVETASIQYLKQLTIWWNDGLWNASLLAFTVQMMLILVLGHMLALSKPVERIIDKATSILCKSAGSAVFSVTLLTIIVAWFNWGLALIFGAIFARKAGEFAAKNNIPINYPLIGACGYSGLMVWHGGLSGSSLAKVAEPGHLRNLVEGKTLDFERIPDAISFSETVFSQMNITISVLLLIALPLFMVLLSKRNKLEVPFHLVRNDAKAEIIEKPEGAERLDNFRFSAAIPGLLIILAVILIALNSRGSTNLSFITPNWINLTFLGLVLIAHGSISKFLSAGDQAISGASGILLQFPLYFGIMGVMSSSGLVSEIADQFVVWSRLSNDPGTIFPVLTFISASFINLFVPSGGGQWAVQGPIIIEGALNLGVSIPKSILALAYGDQLTNMLQPFWALPLLAITGLKARDILPYSFLLMLVGLVIFMLGLYLF